MCIVFLSATDNSLILLPGIAAVSESGSATEPQSFELENDLKHLPWTISNKYYTALVHFSFAETTEVRPQDAAEAPACIFVFNPTEVWQAVPMEESH